MKMGGAKWARQQRDMLRTGWNSVVRRGQRPYFSSRNVPKSVPRPIVSPDSGLWSVHAIMEHGPCFPAAGKTTSRATTFREEMSKTSHCRHWQCQSRRGALDKRKASECNFRSVATEDRLGSLERKMQRRFDLDGIRRTAMTTLVQWCKNRVQCGGEHLHFVNSFLAGF